MQGERILNHTGRRMENGPGKVGVVQAAHNRMLYTGFAGNKCVNGGHQLWQDIHQRFTLINPAGLFFGSIGIIYFLQLLTEVAFTATLHSRLVAVDAKRSCDVIFMQLIPAHYP